MSARPEDLSAHLGVRVAFTEFDGDRAFAEVFDKRTSEALLRFSGYSYAAAHQAATFAIRGPDRRSVARPVRDRRQICAKPAHPLRRSTDKVIS